MEKNVAGKWIVFAYGLPDHANDGQPITGDAANITANIRIDGGAANAVDDVNPTELEDGYYVFDITAAEANGDLLSIHPASSTANVQVIGVPGAVYTRPANFNAMGIESDGDLTQVNTLAGHTAQTGDSYARLGAPAGASIAADLLVIDNFVDDLESRLTAARAGYLDNLNGHTPQSGDSYARIGAPAGASVSADIATIDANVDGVKTKTDSLTFTVANQVDANAIAISGDTAAADNLEATYDGTGYTNDEAPAKQSQLSSIANVGSAVHKPASSYTLTTGTQSANLYTDTEALDGVRHTHTDIANSIDLYYEFMIGGGTPTSVQVTGYLQGGNDSLDIQGYDWVSASWKQIGTMQGSSSSANQVFSYDLFVDMVGSGANEGKVRVRFYAASGLTSATLAIDQIFVAFSQGSEGYDNGAVWFNSNASNTGTEVNIDGTARNPVSTSAALLSLLASTNLKKIEVVPGSTLTLGAAYEGYDVNGNGAVLALNSQNIGGSIFSRFSSVSGVGTTSANQAFFEDCIFGTTTVPPSIMQQCGFGATVTVGSAGDLTVIDGYSTVAGSGAPTFTKTAGQAITAEYRRFSGGLTQSGLQSGDTITIGGPDMGTVELNGADATVEIRGVNKGVTNNLTGSPTVNNNSIKASEVSDILGDTVDLQSRVPSALVGGRMDSNMSAINNDNTAAVNLSKSALGIIYGTAQTGTLSTTQASTDLSGYNDDQLIGRVIVWTGGNCQGEATDITDYANTNGVLTFTALTTAPANTDPFVIV